VFLFFVGLGQLPLYILDEAKNAECAREMWEKGDIVVPTFNGNLRTDKPPLHYFFMMLSYSIFGASAFAARFFSAAMGFFTLSIIFYYTKKTLGQKAAIWTILSLLASLHFLFQFHLAVPDPYLIACITVGIFAFQDGLRNQSKISLFLGYTATALGTLAKGPVALGLIGLVMLLYLILTRQLNLKGLKKLQIPLGVLWFLLLTLPWYVAVGSATDGEWLEGFFFTHNLNRFSSAMENHGGGFWMTFLYIFIGMIPFILFLPQAIQLIIKDLKSRWSDRINFNNSQRFLLLSSIAATVIIGFFTISTTKLPNYTVPAYPFLAVLLGYYLSQIQKTNLTVLIAWTILTIALAIGTFLGVESYELLQDQTYLSYFFLPMILGALSSLFFHFRKDTNYSLRSILGGNIITAALIFGIGLPNVFKLNPVEQSLPLVQNEEKIITYKLFNPAYLFNVEMTLPNYRDIDALQQNIDNKTIILTQERYLKDFQNFPLPLDTIFIQQDLFEMQKSVILRHK